MRICVNVCVGVCLSVCVCVWVMYVFVVHYVNSSRETYGAAPEKWVGLKSSVGGGVNRYTIRSHQHKDDSSHEHSR